MAAWDGVAYWHYVGKSKDLGMVSMKADMLWLHLSKLKPTTNIFVDFDETLFLRNSTEYFIGRAAPIYLWGLILQILDLIKPWRWRHREEVALQRDIFRLKLVLKMAPWHKKVWLKHVQEMPEDLVNQRLLIRLKMLPNPIYIVTYGMDFIVQPILNRFAGNFALLTWSTPDTLTENRRKRKALLIEESLNKQPWEDSLVITDSRLDSDILQKSKNPHLLQWSGVEYMRAGLTPMLPFVYTKKVKRPTESYFTRAIIGHDYLTLLMVFAIPHPHPLLAAVALFLFLLAYFSVYEIGYHENDRLGLILEKNPKISDAYKKLSHHFKPWNAWFFGATFTLMGSVWTAYFNLASFSNPIMEAGEGQSLWSEAFYVFIVFMALIVAVRLVFHWFNRIDEMGRIVPMFFLQLARTAGYLVIFSTNVIGVLFLFTHALSKWFPYAVYRFGGSRKEVPNHLINFLLLATLVSLLWFTQGVKERELLATVSIVILAYSAIRAAKDLVKFGPRLKPASLKEDA